MPKGIMGNCGSLSLIEVLGVSATKRETAQTNISIFSFLVGKHRKPQSINVQTLSTYNTNRHYRVRFYAFVEQPLSKQLYTMIATSVSYCFHGTIVL